MKTLYESILDSDDEIKKDAEEFSSEVGLVVRALIDTFDNKFYWDPDGVKYINLNQRLQGMADCMFGINYSAYDKYRKLFQQTLKDYGIVVVSDKKYDKDFSIDFKGPKGYKVTMKFISFSDYTYVEVKANSANKKVILDLFDKYKKMKH